MKKTQQVKKSDMKEGVQLISRYGTTDIVLRQYDEEMWEVRVWDGSRLVGDKCIGAYELSGYTLATA